MKSLIAKSGSDISFQWITEPSTTDSPEISGLESLFEQFEVVVLADGSVYPSSSESIPMLEDYSNGGIEYKTTITFDGATARVEIPYFPLQNVEPFLQSCIQSTVSIGERLVSEFFDDQQVAVPDVALTDITPSVEELKDQPYEIIHPILQNHVISELMGEVHWFDSYEDCELEIRESFDVGTIKSTALLESPDDARELSKYLNWELQSEMSMGIEKLDNDFQRRDIEEVSDDDILVQMVHTEVLVPWLYKYGEVGVELWNHLQSELFRLPDETTHPIFAPDKQLYHHVTEESDITRVQYVKMVYDLFKILRHEYPIVNADWQQELVTDAYEQLGYPDVDVTDPDIGPTWEAIMYEQEISEIAEVLHEKQNGDDVPINEFDYPIFTYEDITSYDDDAFAYTQTDVPDFVRPNERVLVPSNALNGLSGLGEYNIDVGYQLENYGYIPPFVTMRDEVLPGVSDRDIGVLLPKAVWWNPVLGCFSENTGDPLHINELREIEQICCGDESVNDGQTWVPATWDQLTNSRQIKKFNIGPYPVSDFHGQVTGSISEFYDDDKVIVEPISYWFEKMEEHDVFDEPNVVYFPYNQSIHDKNGWQTGIAISEFPIHHASDQDESPTTDEVIYVRGSVNLANAATQDDVRSWGVRPIWDHVFPDGVERLQRMTSASHAIDIMRQEGDYDPTDKVAITQIPFPVLTRNQIQLSD